MRVTTHNGRAGKHGTYSPKHNDRKFDPKNAEHINHEKSSNNLYWHTYLKKDREMSFEDVEKKFYSKYFTDSLNAQNERYRGHGHKERMKTMDEYRKAKQTCPEETIFQIGNTDETVDYKTLYDVMLEQLRWEQKQFKNVKFLNYAIHTDEEGAPHVHVRKVWIAKGKDGYTVSQTKALKEMGIERPNLSKNPSRYNNPKMTYTQRCRDHFIELCEQKGLTIEKTPDATSKKGLDLDTFKANKEKEKAKKFKLEQQKAKESRDSLIKEYDELNGKYGTLKTNYDELNENNESLKNENKELKDSNTKLTNSNARLKQISENLETKKDELLKLKNSELEEYQRLQGENARLEEKNEKARLSIKSYNDKKAELTSLDDKIKAETGLLKDIIDDKVKASEVEPSLKKKLFNNNLNTKTYDSEMIEKLESLGENVETKYQNMINKNNELAIREKRVKDKEKILKEREKGITEKSNNIDNIINTKVKDQVDIAINKVINPIRQTDKAERQEKFMKKIKAGKNKTVYDLYQEDLKKKINRDLAESFEQQKQQQSQHNKTWNDLEL